MPAQGLEQLNITVVIVGTVAIVYFCKHEVFEVIELTVRKFVDLEVLEGALKRLVHLVALLMSSPFSGNGQAIVTIDRIVTENTIHRLTGCGVWWHTNEFSRLYSSR
jgi:hypothetical protein